MAKFTYADLEGLWIRAGGARAVAPVAAAIALAGSRGDSAAANPNDSNGRGGTQFSGGLWQISNGTRTPVPGWNDPATNASLAVAKFKAAGNSFQPWGEFTSGAWRAWLSPGTTPNLNVPGGGNQPGPAQAQVTAFDPASCLWSFPGVPVPLFGSIGKFCIISKPSARAWLAVGLMVGGGLVAGVGLGFLLAAAAGRSRTAAAILATATRGAVTSPAEQERRAREDEAMEKRLGPGPEAESEGLRIGRGAIRETPEGTRERRRAVAAANGDTPPF